MGTLKSFKVLICAGSGGVGKTTVAASLGVLAARQGLRVLILTIDPSHRLATALGLSSSLRDVVRVPGQKYPGELWAGIIDAESAFSEFVRGSAGNQKVVDEILANPLYRELSTSMSGAQEFTSLDRLVRAVDSKKFDLVILDTPPAQHAIDFLTAPEKIHSLFQNRVTKWFMAAPEQQNLFQRMVSRGTHAVFGALERVTGSEFIVHLRGFFVAVQGIQDSISRQSVRAHRLLHSPECGFVLVTSLDVTKLSEAIQFKSNLDQMGHHLAKVIVNRTQPAWMATDETQKFSAQSPEVQAFYKTMRQFYVDRGKILDELSSQFTIGTSVAKLAELDVGIVGLDALEIVANQLEKESEW